MQNACAKAAATVLLAILATAPVLAEPPFQGTAFLSPDIITAADPSALTGVTYTGRGDRTIWDFRVLDWITVHAYLFEARIYGRNIEFQVNPEFGSVDAALAEVDTYARVLGRLPTVLLSRAEKVHVNAGDPEHPDERGAGAFDDRHVPRVFGANYFDRSFTIHTGYGQRILRDGFLEEVLFHEGGHASLQNHQDALGWRQAQEADGEFISNYARDHPDREDVAESVLPYFALRYRPDRLSAVQRAAIADTIPNRVEYFNGLALDWSPYASDASMDRAVLEALYNATGGPGWTNHTNWLTDSPLSEWFGVTTDGTGRVTALALYGNALSGPIPTVLGNLANLQHLLLWNNALSGPIPTVFGNLTNLQSLDLGDNALSGPIPTALGNLANLEYLALGHNALSGPIPTVLGNLANLWSLFLDGNELSGPIPTVLGNLANLRFLGLGENALSGLIPSELGNLTNLELLRLNGNELSGPIPAQLGNLAKLTVLELDSHTGLCLDSVFPLASPFARLAQESGISVCATGFIDDPIVPGETLVKAVHFTQLRERIDALRGAHGLDRFPWTDSTLVARVTSLRGVHMSELRSALRQAYDAANRTIGIFSTEPVQAGLGIRAWHINELRRAVEALER